jgi:hypothetical protein
VLAVAVAGCGGGQAAHPAAAHHSPPKASSRYVLTCSPAVVASIQLAAEDQHSQDKSEEQNWINLTGGTLTNQGSDLTTLADDLGTGLTASTSSRPYYLTHDAVTSQDDWNTFQTDQSSGLAPGWTSEYNAIKADINQLALDCHVP